MATPSSRPAPPLALYVCWFIPRTGWPILKHVTEQSPERALRLFSTAYVGGARGRVEVLEHDRGLVLARECEGLGA